MTLRRALAALAAGLLGAGALAPTAAADPARPGDFEAVVTTPEPAEGVRAEALGGDSFVRLVVEPGREVVVLGYGGEPYLRIGDIGTVERNTRSPATYQNEDRYGGAELVPPSASVDAEPAWEVVGAGGSYAWHDHRSHWMAEGTLPPGAERGDEPVEVEALSPWSIPLLVDGEPAAIEGRLLLHPAQPAWPGAALAAAVAAVVVALGWRAGAPLLVAGAAAVVAGAAAGAVAIGERLGQPGELAPSPVWVVLPAAAVVAGVLAVVWRRGRLATVAALAAAAVVAPVVVQQLPALAAPVLPTELPWAVARALTAVAAGATAGLAVLAVRAATALVPEEGEPDGADLPPEAPPAPA